MIDWKPIETVKLDTPVLLYVDGVVIEGKRDSKWSSWNYESLNCHGCGCCSSDDPEPTHWAELNNPE